jgi:coenzyme F420-reducing hydrogenase delta subunit
MGDCHYLYGNHMTVKRVTFLQELLAFIGLEGRLHLAWISSAEARKFALVVSDFTEKIRKMGPSPLAGGHGIRLGDIGDRPPLEPDITRGGRHAHEG